MAVSESMIQKVKRFTGEVGSLEYHTDIINAIASHPLLDAEGNAPSDDAWIPTYDLNLATSEIWEMKAAVLAQDYDFSEGSTSYTRSQAYEQAMKQAARFRARRAPRTITAQMEPPVKNTALLIGNMAEVD
jgi:hypothetical protein